MNPPQAESAHPARPRRNWLGEAGLFILVWVAFMQPVRTLAPSLDASWQMMLGYAYDHGLQFGRDLVPTMGPAGFLITASPSVHHLTIRFAWMLLGNAALALIFWRLSRSLFGVCRIIYFAFVVLLLAPFAESLQGLAIVILGLALLRADLASRPLRTALLAAAIGALALFKFTHLTLGAFLVLAAAAHALHRDGLRRAAVIGLGFILGFGGGWKLLGQPLGAIPEFLRLSAEVSRGYVDGMSLVESPRLFWWGVSALLASALYAWNYWRNDSDRPRATAAALMLAATWFLNWKHGFVRADAHTLTLFLACLFPAVAFPALTQEADTPCKRRRLALVSFLALGGIATAYPSALTQALATFNTRICENCALLVELRHPRVFAARLRSDFAQFGRDRRLPRISALVGPATVDVLGAEQALAMFDDFHYTPRPVFQDYYAYTPRLARLNEAFYLSPRAPRFVLQKYETIDGRLPGLDDARVLAQVLTHYALVTEENGWLLWEKHSDPAALSLTPISRATATMGREIPVPTVTDGALWARLQISLTLLGRVQAFLYKPPQLALTVTDAAGTAQTYRLVREMAGDGFLIEPFFPTQAALTKYVAGAAPAGVRSLKVTAADGEAWDFDSDFAVSFERLPELPHDRAPAPPVADSRYRMFNLMPVRVDSPHPAGPFVLEGRETFFIHAPGELEFAPDLAITRLTGAVGMSPGAYAGPQTTDGVEIIIEHVAAAGQRTVLWRRLLDPAKNPADRGLQPFSLLLPGKGRVILRNLTGPKNDPSYDWTLWADLRFQ